MPVTAFPQFIREKIRIVVVVAYIVELNNKGNFDLGRFYMQFLNTFNTQPINLQCL